MTKECYKNLSDRWETKLEILRIKFVIFITHYIKQNRILINYIVKGNKLPRKQKR